MIIFLVENDFASSKFKRITIKIGSDIISDDKVEEIARDCSYLVKELGKEVLIVTSGAIKTGKTIIKLNGQDDIHQKQAYAAIGQPFLMSKYNAAFSKYGQPIAQNLFTREDIGYEQAFENRHHNTIATLERLIINSVIPIINENDTTAVEEIRFGDNDVLSALVSKAIGTELLIFLTSVDGVYTRESYHSENRVVIPAAYLHDLESTKRNCIDKKTANGTGGMLSKISAIEVFGGYSLIVNGTRQEIIRNIFGNNYVGTLFIP